MSEQELLTTPDTSDDELVRLKIPPHNLEAEQSVLGSLMIDEMAWDKVAGVVTEVDFYRRDHRLIFKAIADLAGDNKHIDALTVSERLTSLGVSQDAGGKAYIGEIVKNTGTSFNVESYAKIVRERSVLRQLISVSHEIGESAYQPKGTPAKEILDEAERKIFKIAEQQSTGTGPQALGPLLKAAIEKIEYLYSNDQAITGVSTGFTKLDEMTSGLQKSDLIIVAARPSMGKTTFAMNLVENVLLAGNPVLVFSMEMPASSIVSRMFASLGRIDQTRVQTGKLQEEDWPRIASTISMLKEHKLFIDDTPAQTPTELRARARRVARECGGQLGLIMVDYLQLMRVPSLAENRVAEISEISRSLKTLAKEMQCPVVALSQLNRDLEKRQDKRPMPSDLRESGAIEQDADLIMFIYRDEVYNKDSAENKGLAEIIIGKQRNGPIGKLGLAFLGKYSRFEDLAPEYYRDFADEY